MKKTKKIVKEALRHPEQHAPADLLFMQILRKEQKRIKKVRESEKEVK